MARKSAPIQHGGKLWIFLSRLSLVLIVAMMALLAVLIAVNSWNALWPHRLELVRLDDDRVILGFRVNEDISPDGRQRIQYKVGNRDLNGGGDFLWIYADSIADHEYPVNAVHIERMENGAFFGFVAQSSSRLESPFALPDRLYHFRERWDREAGPLRHAVSRLGEEWQRVHLASLKSRHRLDRAATPAEKSTWRSRLNEEEKELARIRDESADHMAELDAVRSNLEQDRVQLTSADGRSIDLPLSAVADASFPNAMSFSDRLWRFAGLMWRFLLENPREANTEGGIYPALFGTVMLVFLMAVFAFPLGVAAGVYLREYAKDGILSRTARIAVNNLAGVPSIVYGIFGLGFFVYGMGGTIDAVLFPERVAAGINTFGGGGILWSSLTLGLLTLPVVIVATEEALATVPSEVRQGSLALGATRFQTLYRVILPMASPGILTGFILAMARAAGEVAPLMLTGAVKSAHNLPVDGMWPFVHVERKFMHLGFHIYDMGFQSPNVEASKPLVYLTALVLLLLVFLLNWSAITLRIHMRNKYAMKGF